MSHVPTRSEIDPRLVRAIGNPLRMRILRRLQEQTASPTMLARALGEPLGKVSYHVGVLLENEAIELVRTRQVRGALEHFYRPLIRPFFDDEHWAQLPLSARRTLLGQTLSDIFEHVGQASTGESFDDPRTHVSWTPLELDEEGYAQVTALLADLLERVDDIQAEALGRMAGRPSTRRTELAVMHFHRKPSAPE